MTSPSKVHLQGGCRGPGGTLLVIYKIFFPSPLGTTKLSVLKVLILKYIEFLIIFIIKCVSHLISHFQHVHLGMNQTKPLLP